jgi:hypothetical protein
MHNELAWSILRRKLLTQQILFEVWAVSVVIHVMVMRHWSFSLCPDEAGNIVNIIDRR